MWHKSIQLITLPNHCGFMIWAMIVCLDQNNCQIVFELKLIEIFRTIVFLIAACSFLTSVIINHHLLKIQLQHYSCLKQKNKLFTCFNLIYANVTKLKCKLAAINHSNETISSRFKINK